MFHHVNEENSLDKLEISLSQLGSKPGNVIVAGDFNLPSWDWKNKTLKHVKPGSKFTALHYRLGTYWMTGMGQVIQEPTREINTLDLIATNSPSKVSNVQIIPGISDLNIPVIHKDVSPLTGTQ